MPRAGAGVDEVQQILRVGAVFRRDGHSAFLVNVDRRAQYETALREGL
jgi:hypothetical protein